MALRFVDRGVVDYEQAWSEQRHLHEQRVADDVPDTVLLLQHPSVYTAGRRTDPLDRPFDGTPVIDVDRGGKITWHGPGQLVGYPVIRLRVATDVVGYVRTLETALIAACGDLGVPTTRVPGRSGVWVPADDRGPERKIVAIGIRVAKGVTMHGFAVNCDNSLDAYDRIVACGIRDAGVTTLTRELGRTLTVEEAMPVVQRHLDEVLGGIVAAPPTAAALG